MIVSMTVLSVTIVLMIFSGGGSFFSFFLLLLESLEDIGVSQASGFRMSAMGSVTMNCDIFFLTGSSMGTVEELDAVEKLMMAAMGSMPVKDLSVAILNE